MSRVVRDELFPSWTEARVILTHTRPEPMAGLLRQIDTGPGRTRVLGYASRGGTLDTFGMLFANRCTWAHALVASAQAVGIDDGALLSAEELRAVRGEADPRVLDRH